ncbi:MAG TPA: hypothetical protein VJP07_05620 [Dehalococcoidia bacterium]|nr:hypothetical protein [Dehalococcoidia bacterium]
MVDFTGITLQDHYNVTVAEREREIARGAWERRWKRLTARDAAPACCVNDADAPQSAARRAQPPSAALP